MPHGADPRHALSAVHPATPPRSVKAARRNTLAEAMPPVPGTQGVAPAQSGAPPSGGPTRLLTADQLAECWQVPKSLVYRLTRDGRIPAVRLGRYYRYRVAAIEAWEHDNEAVGHAA